MTFINKKILMVTPFHKNQRGNSLTSARLQTLLSARGFNIDRLSLEEADWQRRLQHALDESEYDMVHGFHARHFAQVLQTIPGIRKLPLLLTTTGTDINCDLYVNSRDSVVEALQAAQKIVVFNEEFRGSIGAEFPLFKDKLLTIPQGVFLEKSPIINRSDLGFHPHDFIFLLPSGLRPVKNIELAIEAMDIVHKKFEAIRLLIIGAAIDPQYSQQIMDCIKARNWITSLGELPHAHMWGILSLGDVVINTSQSEGQPQAALEAMSLGKPCVLTAVPGNLNVISQGVEGFYVADRDELISAAQILINDPVRRAKMGQNARRLVEIKFNLEQELDAYSSIYRQMLSVI